MKYEIEKAWKDGKGIVVIYIHGLKNSFSQQCSKGNNHLYNSCIDKNFNYIAGCIYPADNKKINLSEVCKAYDPPYSTCEYVYEHIKKNIEEWIEEAMKF